MPHVKGGCYDDYPTEAPQHLKYGGLFPVRRSKPHLFFFNLFSLIDSLLKCVRKQYVVLKSSGMNTPEMNEDYENIVNIVEDNREVAWADQTMTSDDTEVQPLDAIKNAENNLSLLRTSTGNYVHYYQMIITSFLFVQVGTPNELY